jgi:hypothetical protein
VATRGSELLDDPAGLVLGPAGVLYIADLFNARIEHWPTKCALLQRQTRLEH